MAATKHGRSATGLAAALLAALLCVPASSTRAADDKPADLKPGTALVLSIDVSGSVDEARYNLQLEGIAEALEDPVTLSAISATAGSGIYLSVVTWADNAKIAIDWRRIASAKDAAEVAALVRKIPRQTGDFTCVGRMFRTTASSLIPALPTPVERLVVDVSGDGIDNCNSAEELDAERDGVLALGATINGLPILVPGENDVVGSGAFRAPGFGLRELAKQPDKENTTLDKWYGQHVIGGPGAFILISKGYEDFARALRRKLVTEISSNEIRRADGAN